MSNPASRSNSPRWIRRRTPSWPGISLHPDGNRLAVSFVRQHGKIYMLEGFDESTSWFDRLMRRAFGASPAFPAGGRRMHFAQVPINAEDYWNAVSRGFLQLRV